MSLCLALSLSSYLEKKGKDTGQAKNLVARINVVMQINTSVLAKVAAAHARLLVVTKYYDPLITKQLMALLNQNPIVIGWGENRTTALKQKKLNRTQTHFIGRLQSRQLPDILAYCATIHSLASLKHAEKINQIIEQNNYLILKVFIQVNVARDPAKEGIKPNELNLFLSALKTFKNIKVVGLSSMGWGEFAETQKRLEFKTLTSLRNQFLPSGLTSAGTSRDYEIALEEGINLVRVGRAILKEPFDSARLNLL